MRKSKIALLGTVILGVSWLPAGCGGAPETPTGARRFISIGTAPVGGVFYTVGGALSDILNQYSGDLSWRVSAESTGGTMENIRRLDSGELQFAVANSAITYFAVRGEEGWEKRYPVQTVMTLFPNVCMFVTRANSGIQTIPDIRGKRASVGPQGAGFEYFVRPILRAHGLTLDDFEAVYAGQQNSVDYLGDGSISAAFLGGGVPTASITSAASTMDIILVPFEESAKQELIEDYSFMEPATIPAGTYRGLEEDYKGLNVGSAHLIVAAETDEESVYRFTRIVYEHRQELAEKHRAARAITPDNAPRDTGTEFHPGAIRYYREIGIWSR